MNYKISGWQKLRPNLYDVGGKIVAVEQKFLTTQFSMLFGGAVIASGVIYIPNLITQGIQQETLFILGFIAFDFALGLWLIYKGYTGKKVREENGGIHPTDTLVTLDSSSQTVTRKIGDVDEQIATFSDMGLATKVAHGKHTRYDLQLTWPGHTLNLARSASKKEADELLSDVQMRLGLQPQEQPTN